MERVTKAENAERSTSNGAHGKRDNEGRSERARAASEFQRPTSTSEFARQFDGALEQFEIVRTRDFDRAELFEMPSQPLRVEQSELSFPQTFDQRDECDLGGVAFAVKHRFAEKRAADRDTVEAAGEFAFAPRLDGMGVAELVQS